MANEYAPAHTNEASIRRNAPPRSLQAPCPRAHHERPGSGTRCGWSVTGAAGLRIGDVGESSPEGGENLVSGGGDGHAMPAGAEGDLLACYPPAPPYSPPRGWGAWR